MSAAQVEAAMTRREKIIAAYADGCIDTRALALQFGVSTRTIDRALRGVRPARPVTRTLEAALVRQTYELLMDGMPANWVAETLDVNYSAVVDIAAKIPNRRKLVAEWQSTWAAIYNNQPLLDLHRQFAPRG